MLKRHWVGLALLCSVLSAPTLAAPVQTPSGSVSEEAEHDGLRPDLDHVGLARVVEVREAGALRLHSTVTDLARLRGWSTSVPLPSAT